MRKRGESSHREITVGDNRSTIPCKGFESGTAQGFCHTIRAGSPSQIRLSQRGGQQTLAGRKDGNPDINEGKKFDAGVESLHIQVCRSCNYKEKPQPSLQASRSLKESLLQPSTLLSYDYKILGYIFSCEIEISKGWSSWSVVWAVRHVDLLSHPNLCDLRVWSGVGPNYEYPPSGVTEALGTRDGAVAATCLKGLGIKNFHAEVRRKENNAANRFQIFIRTLDGKSKTLWV